jgi:hypothetical protein
VALSQKCKLSEARLLREADDAEVRLVHAQQHGRLRADCGLVIGCARSVGRPHLAESCTRTLEDVRDAEAVADLDQLPTRHENLSSFGERRERKHDGRRVVVHDQCRLGAGEATKDVGDVVLT